MRKRKILKQEYHSYDNEKCVELDGKNETQNKMDKIVQYCLLDITHSTCKLHLHLFPISIVYSIYSSGYSKLFPFIRTTRIHMHIFKLKPM